MDEWDIDQCYAAVEIWGPAKGHGNIKIGCFNYFKRAIRQIIKENIF
jgi:hypothetical protein